jgi:lysophospholipase L1-like esterase
LISCKKSVENNTATSSNGSTISWLALGDSYTIGQGVKETDRFPTQTVSLLKQKNIKVEKLTYIATTGWTSNDLEKAITDSRPTNHNIVTLLIGVNDQYLGLDTINYKKTFTYLINKAIDITQGNNGNVIVISIPDYSATPVGKKMDTARIRKEIDGFNNINYKIAKEYKCSYLNITELTRESRTAEYIAADSLHPSSLTYSKWAKLLYEIVGKTF